MTIDEVQSLVRLQSTNNPAVTNAHHIALAQAILPPKRITVLWRKVENSQMKDEELSVWLVGQESPDGYKIIMRDNGKQFGPE